MMKQSRLELRENYDKACNAYLQAFCEKHGFDYADTMRNWVNGDVGGAVECGDYIVSMNDIIADIDWDAPEDEYGKYYAYCLRVGSIGNGELKTPNYDSWLRGCPRMNEAQLTRLEELQQDIWRAESHLKEGIDNTNLF